MITKALWQKDRPRSVKGMNVGKLLDLYHKSCSSPSSFETHEDFTTAENVAEDLLQALGRVKDKLKADKSDSANKTRTNIANAEKEIATFRKVVEGVLNNRRKLVTAQLDAVLVAIAKYKQKIAAIEKLASKRQQEGRKLAAELKSANTIGSRVKAKLALKKIVVAAETLSTEADKLAVELRDSDTVVKVRGPGAAGLCRKAGLGDADKKSFEQEFKKNMKHFTDFESDVTAARQLCTQIANDAEIALTLADKTISEDEAALKALTKIAATVEETCKKISLMIGKPPGSMLRNFTKDDVVKKTGNKPAIIRDQIQVTEDKVVSLRKLLPDLVKITKGSVGKIPEASRENEDVSEKIAAITATAKESLEKGIAWVKEAEKNIPYGKELLEAFAA